MAAGSSLAGTIWRLVTPASAYAAMRSRTYDAGPTRLVGLEPLQRHLRLGVALVAAEVEVLDLLGLLLVAVLAGEVVVEVLAARAHAADVQREERPREVEQRLGLRTLADGDHAAGRDLQAGPAPPGVWPCPCRARRPRRSGPARGGRGTAASRRRTPPSPRRSSGRAPRSRSGRTGARACVSSLSGLPSPVPCPSGSGRVKMPSCRSVSRRRPRRTRSTISRVRAERLVVRHPVEALDHLRPARPEAEDRPALRHVVEAGRGLQDRAGGARVDVEDRRPDLDRLGLGGEVPHQRGGVEAVRLRHPQRVQPRLLERGHLVGRLPGVAGVHQLRGELHASDCDRTAVTVARRVPAG